MVLKTDFERRNIALLRDITHFTVSRVPVNDFWLSIFSIFLSKKSFKIIQLLKNLPNIPFKSKVRKQSLKIYYLYVIDYLLFPK